MGPWFEPGPGSHFPFQINQLRSVTHRLLVFWSLEIGLGRWAHNPLVVGASTAGPATLSFKLVAYAAFRLWDHRLLVPGSATENPRVF